MDEMIPRINTDLLLNHMSKLAKIVIRDLDKSKILLNPIKLSIIRILFVYSSFPSFKIREMLEISWGKFSANISSLLKQGYISTNVEFFNESPTQVLQIEHFGRIKFLELREIMKGIFDLELSYSL